MPADGLEIGARLGLDLAGMALILGVAAWRKVMPRALASTLLVFNVSLFAVVQVLTGVEFSVGAGFGLFAVLSIIRLRSELFSSVQLAFVFATLSAALVTGAPGFALPYAAALTALVAAVTVLVGEMTVTAGTSCCLATLDLVTGDEGSVKEELSRRLHLDVVGYTLMEIDTVRETMTVEVRHRVPGTTGTHGEGCQPAYGPVASRQTEAVGRR